jgi:hypothetical protein
MMLGRYVICTMLYLRNKLDDRNAPNLEMSDSEEPIEHGKPAEGMMCLCSMEDITEEDLNYGALLVSPLIGLVDCIPP